MRLGSLVCDLYILISIIYLMDLLYLQRGLEGRPCREILYIRCTHITRVLLLLLLLLLQLYFNTELFHNIKLTKYIQRENKMSDLPIGRIYIKIIITFVAIKAYF